MGLNHFKLMKYHMYDILLKKTKNTIFVFTAADGALLEEEGDAAHGGCFASICITRDSAHNFLFSYIQRGFVDFQNKWLFSTQSYSNL